MLPYVNIHTHRPTGSGIELRTAGVHPWDAATQDAATLGQRLGGAQAVGETGLDFVRGADRAAQLSALRTQLRLARERGLPVVLHCVRAFEPLMRELAASEPRAVFSPEPMREGAMILCEEQNKKSNVGTISYIPALFGIGCASVVIRDLIGELEG